MGGCASQAGGAFAEDDSLMVLDAAQQWRPARLVEVQQGGGGKKNQALLVEFTDEAATGERLTLTDPDIPQRVRRLRRASEGDAAWAAVDRDSQPDTQRRGSTGVPSKLAHEEKMPAAPASSFSLSPATDHDEDDDAEDISWSGAPAAGSSDNGGDSGSSPASSRSGDDADSESAAGMSSRSRQRRRQGMRRRSSELTAAVAAGGGGSPGSPATTFSSQSSRGRSTRETSFDLPIAQPQPAVQVICLETFQTKSGRWASRWRPAHIVSWNQGAITAAAAAGGAAAAKARISYDGWSSRHDITLSMATEWSRLALRGSLTEEEMAAGLPLAGAALESSRRAFSPQAAKAAASGARTGSGAFASAPAAASARGRITNSGRVTDIAEPPQTPSADAWRWEGRGSTLSSTASNYGGNGTGGGSGGNGSMPSSSARRRASSRGPAAAEAAAAPPLPLSAFKPGHVFRKGDTVDCLDYFQSAKTNQRASRWRPAEVVAVEEVAREGGPLRRRVKIHFHNWADKWDIWLDVNAERDLRRLAPPFTRARVASAQPQNNMANSGNSNRSSSLAATYPQSGSGVAEDLARHRNSSGSGPAVMAAAAARDRRAARGERQASRRRSGGGGYGGQGGVPTMSPGREGDDGSLSDGVFCDALRRRGLEILEVEPDGNCLFRAVGHQIYGDPELHNEVRRACADHMARHHQRFSTFVAEEEFHEYLRRVRQPCVWGDDLEIRALEEVYDRPIHIYAPHAEGFGPMKIDFDAGAGAGAGDNAGSSSSSNNNSNDSGSSSRSGVPADVAPITLSYHGQSHYNSVLDRRHRYPLKPRATQAILSLRIAQHASGPGPPAAAAAAAASAAAAPGAGAPPLRSGRSMAGGGRTGEPSLLARRWAGLTRTSA